MDIDDPPLTEAFSAKHACTKQGKKLYVGTLDDPLIYITDSSIIVQPLARFIHLYIYIYIAAANLHRDRIYLL